MGKNLEHPQIHLWCPDLLSGTGGIQVFSQQLTKVLCTEFSKKLRIVVKNDLPEAFVAAKDTCHISGCGHWNPRMRSLRFAMECLIRAWLERPSLIISTHLHFGPIAPIIRQFIRVPYVLVAHGIEAWQLNTRFRQRALCKADLVLAVSRYTRDYLIREVGLSPQRVQTFPNTFSPEQFRILPKSPRLLRKYSFTSTTPVILTVCRLAEKERYKGYDQMIRALPQILREVPEARYMLVGTGPDRSRIESLIAEIGVQNAIVLAGFVPDDELAEHYCLCDVFAMPSKGEGFGIVYLEALACGKPVLAGNRDGSRDALADGELGILVDPDDIDQIAAEIIRVLRREHTHPNIFRPEFLRERVTALFGFETFKRTVAEHLRPFLEDENLATKTPNH